MAKKKQKKVQKEKFEYLDEIIGIILILVAVIGIGGYGPAGSFIRSFAVFLVGIPYTFFLAAVLAVGGYLVVKREPPNFLNIRLIGLYIICVAMLVFLHAEFVTNTSENFNILKETWNNILLSYSNISQASNCGGGMIGAILSWLFYSLFKEGIYVVIVTILILGIILFFNTSISVMLSKLKDKIKFMFKREPKEVREELEEDNKVIISSMNQITKAKEKEVIIETPQDKKEEVIEEKQEEVKPSINSNYQLPPLSLLKTGKSINQKDNELFAKESIAKLDTVLKDFEINGKIVQVNIGPTVTQYELELKAGTKVSKLLNIQREIALALAAKDVRIQAPIPGKNTIGIELPNKVNSSVTLKEILECIKDEKDEKAFLAAGLGKDIRGKVKWVAIDTTPHMLVAGATGAGKSVCINCIITSLLMRTKPDMLKLVLVDPKKVEFSMYNGIPHLLTPVVTDPKKASIALKNIVAEMEKRYDIFEKTKCKNIKMYNQYCEKHPEYIKLPYIVVIIDELADLMLIAAKEVEDSIMRITQMARAAGIHLIVATQRPSTDVITGVVKANIPSRIAFTVSSSIDSRTILDSTGAEKLLGKGDMLFSPMGENVPIRIQGAFISEEEIEKVVNFTISQQKAQYDESLTEEKGSMVNDNYSSDEEYDDPLYNEIVDFAVHTGKISASLIQRKYRIGYNRAARIVDLLEERGIIGPQNGSKPREVLVKLEEEMEE